MFYLLLLLNLLFKFSFPYMHLPKNALHLQKPLHEKPSPAGRAWVGLYKRAAKLRLFAQSAKACFTTLFVVLQNNNICCNSVRDWRENNQWIELIFSICGFGK